jgi:hypothetical protein
MLNSAASTEFLTSTSFIFALFHMRWFIILRRFSQVNYRPGLPHCHDKVYRDWARRAPFDTIANIPTLISTQAVWYFDGARYYFRCFDITRIRQYIRRAARACTNRDVASLTRRLSAQGPSIRTSNIASNQILSPVKYRATITHTHCSCISNSSPQHLKSPPLHRQTMGAAPLVEHFVRV